MEKVAVLSADFHIPRIQALCRLIQEKEPIDAELAFIMAETKIKQLAPGAYDAEIDAAYSSPDGQKRLLNEALGLKHIQTGNYVMSEFQLHKS